MISEMARGLLNEYNLLTRKTGKTEVEPGSYTPAFFEACDKEIEAGNKVVAYIASLESQLADAITKRDALMDCFFEFETIAPNGELMASVLEMHKRLESLESQLAEAKAKLAGYEVGYDPAERLPDMYVDVWIAIEIPSNYLYYVAHWRDDGYRGGSWVTREDGARYRLDAVARWFPLPSAPKEDE